MLFTCFVPLLFKPIVLWLERRECNGPHFFICQPNDGERGKVGVTKLLRILPLGTMNACTKWYGKYSNSYWDIFHTHSAMSVSKLIRIHPLGTMNVSKKRFHGSLFKSFCNITGPKWWTLDWHRHPPKPKNIIISSVSNGQRYQWKREQESKCWYSEFHFLCPPQASS